MGRNGNRGPRITWRDSDGSYHDRPAKGRRAYGDFRAYKDVGGGLEALAGKGRSWGTKNKDEAEALFAKRLNELQEKRKGRTGVGSKSIGLRKLAALHLRMKKKAGNTTDRHLIDLEQRLRVAVDFFGAEVDPKDITPADVREWVDKLAATPSHKGGTLAPVTQRNYLFALSGLYGRAAEQGYVPHGYNPVGMLQEKPPATTPSEAKFFEVPEAALILEAARVVEKRDRINATPGLSAIVATFLLTGGRKSEVLGLDVEDVSFDRGKVYFRPNDHRGLKTKTSHRIVPLWPQLRDILQEWMYGGDTPQTSGLLFPGRTGEPIGDLRKSLDAIGKLCGMEEGEVRTKAFRHTYCAARLQTVQRIVRPGADPSTDNDPYEWVPVTKYTVQREMGHGGSALVDRVYGHVGESLHRSEVVEYRTQQHREALGERLTALLSA